MKIIIADSCGKAWLEYLAYVLCSGEEICDDKELIVESNLTVIRISDFLERDPVLEQYGDESVLNRYTAKICTTKIVPPFKLSYGERLFSFNGVNQIEWLIGLLKAKHESKSAAVSLLKANEPYEMVPCLTTIFVKIRKNALQLTAIFRSQNVFYAYGNFTALHKLQCDIAKRLSIPCGEFTAVIHCPHLYYKDLDTIRKILKVTGYDK